MSALSRNIGFANGGSKSSSSSIEKATSQRRQYAQTAVGKPRKTRASLKPVLRRIDSDYSRSDNDDDDEMDASNVSSRERYYREKKEKEKLLVNLELDN